MTTGAPTVIVVGAGYEGKRRCYERLTAIGARLVIVDEPGHWSESLVELDVFGQIGQEVAGPDKTFATVLAELTLSGKNLRRARSLAARVLSEPPRVLPD